MDEIFVHKLENGSVIADLHDGQVVFLSKRLNHFMRVVMIDFGDIMYIDRIRFTKALITFIEGELQRIGLSHSQKDLEFIINGLLEEIDNTASMIEPHFLTETEFCHEAAQFRSLLVQQTLVGVQTLVWQSSKRGVSHLSH